MFQQRLVIAWVVSQLYGGLCDPPTDSPKCSLPQGRTGKVYDLTINGKPRCFAALTNRQSSKPRPVVIYHHGHTRSAADCGTMRTLTGDYMGAAVGRNNIILICTEAVQYQGQGGSWSMPMVFNSTTGSQCTPGSGGATEDTAYMKAVIEKLKSEPDVYDTSRIFIHGCSQGAAFSTYSASCVHEWYGAAISAWSSHSTGLVDANTPDVHLPGNAGEAPGCEYWPFYPGTKKSSPPLKACILDNKDDSIPSAQGIPESSQELVSKWQSLGNKAKLIMYDTGGHCGTHDWDELFKCLDDGTGRLIEPSSASSVQV